MFIELVEVSSLTTNSQLLIDRVLRSISFTTVPERELDEISPLPLLFPSEGRN